MVTPEVTHECRSISVIEVLEANLLHRGTLEFTPGSVRFEQILKRVQLSRADTRGCYMASFSTR